MKSLIAVLVLVAVSTTSGFAQTKKIFHRSHSGKMAGFSIYADGNLGYLYGEE